MLGNIAFLDLFARRAGIAAVLLAGLMLAGGLAAGGVSPWAQPAGAASERLFTSFDIAVDRRAGTAGEARALAIAAAEARAFRMLLGKIVASDDIASIPVPGPGALRSMVRGFEVADERSSTTRYLARLTITFEPEKIRAFLGRQGIPFSETAPRALLVLPVLRRGGAYLLWEENNVWRQAWDDSDSRNRLMDFRFASGDFGDQLALTGHQAFRGSPVIRMRELASRYGVEETLLVVAETSRDARTGQLTVRFSYRQGASGKFNHGQIKGGAAANPEALLRGAANAVMTRLDLDWKARTLTHFGESRRLRVALAVDKIEDWVSYRDRLKEIPLVRSFTLDRLTLPVSHITIGFVGGTAQLQLALRQVGLGLEEIDDGWSLHELVDQSQIP